MTDMEVKRNIESALEFEPSVDAADIGISVDGGVVTLRGNVGSYAARATAERVTLHIYGVKGVANELVVRLVPAFERNDTDLAQAAVAALAWNVMIPQNRLTVSVSNGWVTLKGTLDWQFQKDAAARVLRDLVGVKGVANDIIVKAHIRPSDVKAKIEAAFTRSAELDARRVNVTLQDGKVILTGNVRTWSERQEAERAAYAAPGVTQVDDRLSITP